MKLTSIARSVVLLAVVGVAGAADESAKPYPPASIGPVLENNTNPPTVAKLGMGTTGTIERLDPALDSLLTPDAKIEIVAEGLQWAEGPVWRDGGLFFSDVPQNTNYRLVPGQGVAPYLKPSGYTGATPRGGEPGSNGLTVDHEGRLTLCQHGDRRVAHLEKDGKTVTVLADHYKGKRFNSPNDLCYDAKGNLYFTDPPYGLEAADKDPKKETENAAYFLRADGELARLNLGDIVYPDGKKAALKYPNGIVLSPDEKSLYITDSDPEHPVYMKYDVQPDGNVANGKLFFDAHDMLARPLPGLPDGSKVDTKGNLWAAGPGGILIFSPEGKHLGTLLTGVPTGNCAWGDDGSTLYICANHTVCRVKTLTKGTIPGPK